MEPEIKKLNHLPNVSDKQHIRNVFKTFYDDVEVGASKWAKYFVILRLSQITMDDFNKINEIAQWLHLKVVDVSIVPFSQTVVSMTVWMD